MSGEDGITEKLSYNPQINNVVNAKRYRRERNGGI